jgi:hypothetical protein
MLKVVQGEPKLVIKTKPAPTTPPTSTKTVAAPATISEHGQGGGSTSKDTGRKPTSKQTRTGYGTAAASQPTSTDPALPQKPVRAVPSGVNTNTGSASAALQGYTTSGPAQPEESGYKNVPPIERRRASGGSSSGGGYKPGGGLKSPKKGSTVPRTTTAGRRELEGFGGGWGWLPNPFAKSTSLTADLGLAIQHGADHAQATVTPLSKEAKHDVIRVTKTAGALLEAIGKTDLKIELSALGIGEDLGKWLERNPGDLAAISSVLAVVAPPWRYRLCDRRHGCQRSGSSGRCREW